MLDLDPADVLVLGGGVDEERGLEFPGVPSGGPAPVFGLVLGHRLAEVIGGGKEAAISLLHVSHARDQVAGFASGDLHAVDLVAPVPGDILDLVPGS